MQMVASNIDYSELPLAESEQVIEEQAPCEESMLTNREKQIQIRTFLVYSYNLIQEAKEEQNNADKAYIVIEVQKALSYVICWSTNLSLQYFNHYSQWLSMAKFNAQQYCEVLEKFILYYLTETKK